ncbi:aldo/keto reductase [Cognatiyoonia sp. IB215446]|uniref:aldo/keto reductase n=1 Tax=Cognatiyoonia sp. IB215446 TaxID=3097355 RepID=UPI002A0FAB5E|nr:aldo/keto reductase [Cognatiyoonia sp. IB215446]MDX8349440.1 aldo/keto reductase [Cognatiyoonia sp. IB215446]
MHDARRQRQTELVLGTAQLGMAYGVTNKTGKLGQADAVDLLALARKQGIQSVDTARAYGTSEDVIGCYQSAVELDERFQVLTKLDPGISKKTTAIEVAKATQLSLDQSRKALGAKRLSCVMLHRPDQILGKTNIVRDVLQEQQREGRIGKIGVSVSEPSELLAVLRLPEIQHVQFPFNFLDHRFENPSITALIHERKDVTVHVRSVFLQGLLVARRENVRYERLGTEGIVLREFLETLEGLFEKISAVEIALNYVRCMDWIDGIVVGTASRSELMQIAAAHAAPVNEQMVLTIRAHRPKLSAHVLNPANWPRDWT